MEVQAATTGVVSCGTNISGSVMTLSLNLWQTLALRGRCGQLMRSVAIKFIVVPFAAVCTVMLVLSVVGFSLPPLYFIRMK